MRGERGLVVGLGRGGGGGTGVGKRQREMQKGKKMIEKGIMRV